MTFVDFIEVHHRGFAVMFLFCYVAEWTLRVAKMGKA